MAFPSRPRCTRTLAPVLGLLLVACGREPNQPPPPPPSSYTVTATVADSITGEWVPFVAVVLGGSVALPDPFSGSYVFKGVRAGTHELSASSPEHRPYRVPLTVSGDREFHIRMLRLAPAITGIQVEYASDRTYVTWVDLDGDFPDAAPYLFCSYVSGQRNDLLASDSALARQDINPTTRLYTFRCGQSAWGDMRPNLIESDIQDRGGHWVKFECRPVPEWRCRQTRYYSSADG